MQKLLRKMIGWAANYTPNVIYYPKHWNVRVNDIGMKMRGNDGEGASHVSVAATSMVCALAERTLKPSDTITIELGGVEYGGTDIGDFIVTVRRAHD